jgi:hypothetical protein
MKKLRIDLGDLRVESFATVPAPAREGAVHAYVGTIGEPWQSLCKCPLGWSIASCPDVTCGCSA